MSAAFSRPVTKPELLGDPTTERQLGPPAGAGPVVEITPTEQQYRQLMRDLKVLRGAGAHSNTAAILEAVRRMAAAAAPGYDAAHPDTAGGR
jgi:hypothetical protein